MRLKEIKNCACLGTGTIGASFATNFALKGLHVNLYSPIAESVEQAKKDIADNLSHLVRKNVITAAVAEKAQQACYFTGDIKEAVSDVQFIQECGPETNELKQEIIAEVEKYVAADTIIASSTSGLLISEIAKYAKHPERIVGGHPFNPPHLVPLVEVCKGEKTSPEVVQRAYDFYKKLGKVPVIVKKEVSGFIANRLQTALYREVQDLVCRGVCSVEDVDKALTFGPGIRWGIMGANMIFHLGSPNGIKALSKALKVSSDMKLKDIADWKESPADWPDIAQAGVEAAMANYPKEIGTTVEEIKKFRDDMLVEMLKLHRLL
jgi:carnitine 3-dehydrogenase